MLRSLVLLLLLGACSDRTEASPPHETRHRETKAAAPARPIPETPTTLPAAPRIVAIGDLHGDIESTRRVLRLAGAIDRSNHWTGGDLVVVQTGDILDRGDGEEQIFELLERLHGEAAAAGGALHMLLGNHEVMNVDADFRYVTEDGMGDFSDLPLLPASDPRVAALPRPVRARAAAFLPRGPMARALAAHNVVLRVGRTLFVHGGLTEAHVAYGLERINREVRAHLATGEPLPEIMSGDEAPIWHRGYSQGEPDCDALGRMLAAADADRLVVGHTVQEGGISLACSDRVARIDVGLASFYDGPIQALEIRGDTLTVLRVP